MPASIYTKLVNQAIKAGFDVTDRSKKSVKWLRERYNDISKASVAPAKFIDQSDRKRKRGKIGRMYMFVYDPQGKRELPFYDRFPLIFYIKPTEGGFQGLNLHYLPPFLRARLMDLLLETEVNGTVSNETTRLKISYPLLIAASRFYLFKPCFKQYLHTHVRSELIYVPPEEWNMTIFLPSEQFKKATKEQVWKNSRSTL